MTAATTTSTARHAGTRRFLGIGVLAAVVLLGAGCSDDTDDAPETTSPQNSTTTGVPSTSSSVPVPTSNPGGAAGQGTQPPQPGGTAQPDDTSGAAEPGPAGTMAP
jgi:hypothetical protein